MKFFIKQLVGMSASPLVLCFGLLTVAAVLRFNGRNRWALRASIAAVTILYLGSTGIAAVALLAPLERQFPPFAETASASDLTAVVVLGSSYTPNGPIPVTGALDPDGLARIVEGVSLLRRIPQGRLIVSGGAPPPGIAPAHGYARLARQLGVPESAIVVLDQPRDTRGEAEAVVRVLGQQRFLLVTSAYHMPRSMRLMYRAGARPVAAPTAQRLVGNKTSWQALVPTSRAMQRVERALHEYLGLAAISMGLD
jgi:uncharacterized SAM-binding protein YcdF (DUF218 family)